MNTIVLIRRSLLVLCLVAAGSVAAVAQNFEITPVGTDETFNVATWNIEHFGTSGPSSGDTETQFANVVSVMQQANVHLWALQEMQTQHAFNELVEALGDGWGGVWQADQTQHQIGYGFIYRTDRVQNLQTQTILTDHAHAFAFRPPLLMRANLHFPEGTIENVRFINIHAKCCGSVSDWERRSDAAVALKNYVDNFLAANFKVLVLGDLNDELRWSITQGRPSPYRHFRTDEENYHFGTLSVEDAGIPTWCANAACTSGSTLDHILFTRPMFGDYVEDSTARYDSLLENIPNYRSSTSDHVAVYALLDFFQATSGQEGAVAGTLTLDAPYPNPFHEEATISFTLPEAAQVRIEAFDALGRRVSVVDEGPRAAGRHEVILAAEGLTSGLYLVRMTATMPGGVHTATRRAIRLP